MKRHNLLLIMTTLILFIAPIMASSGEETGNEPFPGYNKLDVKMRAKWQAEMSMGEMDVFLPCLIRVTEPITPEKEEALKKAGVEISGVLKSIINGRILLANLPDLVKLDFVISVEGAIPLGYKKGLKRGVWK